MILFKCDRCNKELKEKKELWRLHIYQFGTTNCGNKIRFNKHLCKDCLNKILVEYKEEELK